MRGRMDPPRVPQQCPAEVAELIGDCVDPDPTKRPSAWQLVERLQAAPASSPQAASPGVPPRSRQRQSADSAAASGSGSRPAAALPPRPSRSLSTALASVMEGQLHAQQQMVQPPESQVQRLQRQLQHSPLAPAHSVASDSTLPIAAIAAAPAVAPLGRRASLPVISPRRASSDAFEAPIDSYGLGLF